VDKADAEVEVGGCVVAVDKGEASTLSLRSEEKFKPDEPLICCGGEGEACSGGGKCAAGGGGEESAEAEEAERETRGARGTVCSRYGGCCKVCVCVCACCA
jgi:hypothetical protein